MTYHHVVARTANRVAAFRNAQDAWWLWERLRNLFPYVLAACLMPDHLHLLGTFRVEGLQVQLGRLLSGFTRHRGLRRLWEPVPEPKLIGPSDHLSRQLRYIVLNPCRAGLVLDPFCWPWSTYRGIFGAEYAPWVSMERVAGAFGQPTNGFASSLHEYVSGDPSVRVEGTPLPVAASRTNTPLVPLGLIADATRSATPLLPKRIHHRLFVQLASHQGWRDARVLADALDLHPHTIRRLTRAKDPSLLAAGALCLGDERLRFVPDPNAMPKRRVAA